MDVEAKAKAEAEGTLVDYSQGCHDLSSLPSRFLTSVHGLHNVSQRSQQAPTCLLVD